MNSADVLDCLHDSIWLLFKLSGPFLLTALFVGLMVSIFQALTQIQEMTLSFIPKVLGVFFVMLWLMPVMGRLMQNFSHQIFTYMTQVVTRSP